MQHFSHQFTGSQESILHMEIEEVVGLGTASRDTESLTASPQIRPSGQVVSAQRSHTLQCLEDLWQNLIHYSFPCSIRPHRPQTWAVTIVAHPHPTSWVQHSARDHVLPPTAVAFLLAESTRQVNWNHLHSTHTVIFSQFWDKILISVIVFSSCFSCEYERPGVQQLWLRVAQHGPRGQQPWRLRGGTRETGDHRTRRLWLGDPRRWRLT